MKAFYVDLDLACVGEWGNGWTIMVEPYLCC